MLLNIYSLLGMLMWIWYGAFRWKLLGTNLGKFIVEEQRLQSFTLNWWFAPINLLTAFGSVLFITIVLVDFNYSFKLRWLYWLGWALALRNGWYSAEDIQDYITSPSFKQAIFIVIDIAMVLYCAIWIHIFKGMN